ncbi:MAG: hypothetical protein MI725_06800 [Pirellulales bacterium]|nr:hypothetical protein [Pirellulales bacterium]
MFKSLLIGLTVLATSPAATACPFCSATQQTISEEIDAAEICVIAKLVQAAPVAEEPADFDPADADTGLAKFAVQTVLRGEEQAAEIDEIEVVYFGSGETNKLFLINALSIESLSASALAVPRIDWTIPLPLSPRGVQYVKQLDTLPKKGADRLAFFQQYLEDEDPLLAQDAYDEFARAPYQEVIDLADRMDRDQLMRWIEDPQVGPTRRRLYLTMLGVCGEAADAQKLESLLLYDYQLVKPGITTLLATAQSGPAFGASVVDELVRADIRRKQQCLDALIAAYLKLIGPQGLPLIERKFLQNPDVEYSHIYAALMALRFHGEETDVLPRERLLASMRLLLDNKDVADQVVVDLSRWEDWSVLDKLVSLFKDSEKDGWIRQPVVSYLLTAAEQPGDVGARANTALVELEEIDPECVKRTRKHMSFGLFARAVTKSADSENEKAKKASLAEKAPPQAKTTPGEATSQRAKALPLIENSESPSRLTLISVPIIAGLLLMGIFALLLRGADVRSGSENL